MIDPPYVYGYLDGEKENSAIYWCENKDQQETKYFLSIYLKFESTENQMNGCTNKIGWGNYPGGLSYDDGFIRNLDDFVYMDNPSERPPKGIAIENRVIKSEYDGVSTFFYCHEGKWLVSQFH